MSKNRVKKEHHVPQMYLRAWADSNDGLFVLLKEQKKVIGSRVGDVSCEGAFYDAPVKPDVEPQYVEHQLAKIEGILAPFLKELSELTPQSKLITFDNQRSDAISLFIGLQILRSLESRKQFEEGLQFMVDEGSKIVKDLHSISVPLTVKPDAIKHDHVDFIATNLVEFGDLICKKTLLIGFRLEGDSFWTSDNPVLMLNTGHGNGLESLGVIVLLPVSPSVVLIATDNFGLQHLTLVSSKGPAVFTGKEIERLNNMQVFSAVRQVLSNQHKFKRVLRKLNKGHFVKPARSSAVEKSEFYAQWKEEFSKACLEEPFDNFQQKSSSS